ncbi:MAG: amidase family protein, partial [Halioglobus sp.]|nr:amidase family protein [Halioglobus sp.]
SIARAHQIDPHIHAIVEHCSAHFLERSGGDSSGPFAGVPTFIKDMNDLIGLPTRYGSAAYEGAQAATKVASENHAFFVDLLRGAQEIFHI